jgi:phosphatidylglycerophosphatase A
MRALIVLLATAFYSGFVPYAPGTAGSVVGIGLWWLVFRPLERTAPLAALILFAVLFVAGCFISDRAEIIFGQRDSSLIVIDEVMGMVATMFFNPAGVVWMLAGFAAFRLFDVLKPFPASWIDSKMSGGVAVMLDDLAAAVYANLTLQILAFAIRAKW